MTTTHRPQETHRMPATQTTAELLTAVQADIAARRQATRDAAAELAVLCVYDLQRELARHDYGSGQRTAELNRRRRALELGGTYSDHGVTLAYAAAGVLLPASSVERAGAPLTAEELRAAWNRVALPRIARLAREPYRHGTPSSRRTRRAWDQAQTWLERLEREALEGEARA